MLEQEYGKYKIKSKEQLVAGGFNFQWFSYVQLRERFKEDNRTFLIKKQKTKFEVEWYTNDEHAVVKMYKFY